MTQISTNLVGIFDEIETSLTLCNLRKIHNSIIAKTELNKIIREINNELNFWELTEQTSGQCKINI